MQRLSAHLFIATYILVALFGVVLLAPMGSYMPACPFAAGCVSAVEYLSHWQSAFAAVLAETVSLGLIFLVFVAVGVPLPKRPLRRYRVARVTVRPTVFQELFSRGILHRKEP